MFRALFSLTVFAAATTAIPAAALEAQQRVLKEQVVQQPDGTEQKTYVDASLVVPGNTVVYALIFRNDQEAPAEDIVLVMPVPEDIAFIENSATNRLARTDFSADGGTTFETRERLNVFDSDGNWRPADAMDITHVRWSVVKAIQPGEVGQLWFKGILK